MQYQPDVSVRVRHLCDAYSAGAVVHPAKASKAIVARSVCFTPKLFPELI